MRMCDSCKKEIKSKKDLFVFAEFGFFLKKFHIKCYTETMREHWFYRTIFYLPGILSSSCYPLALNNKLILPWLYPFALIVIFFNVFYFLVLRPFLEALIALFLVDILFLWISYLIIKARKIENSLLD